MSRGYLRPALLFAVAFAALFVLIVAAVEVRSPDCRSSGPEWFTLLFWSMGPLSLLAAFSAVLSYGIRQAFHPVGAFLAAAAFAALWIVLGLYVLFAILVPNGCLS